MTFVWRIGAASERWCDISEALEEARWLPPECTV